MILVTCEHVTGLHADVVGVPVQSGQRRRYITLLLMPTGMW